jgi:YggT family protein
LPGAILTTKATVVYAIFNLVIDTAATIIAGLLLLRFWIQAVRVRPPMSLGQFMFRLTDWLVLPLRRLLPALGGYDWASLIGACLITLVSMAVQLGGRSAFAVEPWLWLSLLSLVHAIAYGFIGLVILEVILSWVNPHAPIAPTVRALTDPVLAPFRRILPSIAGVDLSPILAFLALRILVFVVENMVYSMV